jgi:hypothetical protein
MSGAHPARSPVRFGAFEVDFRTGELRNQGLKVLAISIRIVTNAAETKKRWTQHSHTPIRTNASREQAPDAAHVQTIPHARSSANIPDSES